MESPTFDNFVHYEKTDAPDEDGCSLLFNLYGIRNPHDPNSIYLWRNYNTFDEEPTPIPEGFKLLPNGYENCEDCVALNGGCCPAHIKHRISWLQDFRFGTKVFAEDYTPVVVNYPVGAEEFLTHDNGGRPFKVFVDHERKEVHIYSVNRNIIFARKSYRKNYSHTNMVKFMSPVEFKLAMNPKCSGSDVEEYDDPASDDHEMPDSESSSEDQDVYNQTKIYDQHIGTYSYQKIWIPDGLYLTLNDEGNVVQDKCSGYYGNSILAHLGTTDAGLNKYLWISCSVKEFTIEDDEILRYYSTVGNSDVPYPVAIGTKYIYFMLDMIAQPIEKYANLTETQLSDAYSYFYGHTCFICHGSKCDCLKPIYDSAALSYNTICKRDF